MNKVLDALAAAGYGVQVRSQYHAQIACGPGFHDIWFTKYGLKFKAHGQRSSVEVSLRDLLNGLAKYNYETTDLGMMEAVRFAKQLPLTTGVFCDAGWKAGTAKLCVVVKRSSPESSQIHWKEAAATSSYEAELAAFLWACELVPGEQYIYIDNSQVVANHPRAKWLNRKQNREADAMSNLRGAPATSSG